MTETLSAVTGKRWLAEDRDGYQRVRPLISLGTPLKEKSENAYLKFQVSLQETKNLWD